MIAHHIHDMAIRPRAHPADPLWLIVVSGIAWAFLVTVLLFVYIAIGG